MRDAKKKRLREAWRGALTAEQIARSAGIGEKMLRRFWAAEKVAGRLPDGPRPHFLDRSQKAEPVEVIPDDDSPIADPNRVCDWECRQMLAALQREHSAPALDHDAPDAWLKFDGKGMPTPTHAMLMRMCRDQDRRALVVADAAAMFQQLEG
jgi:hypothetical protein